MSTTHEPLSKTSSGSERRRSRRFRFPSIIRIREGEKLHDCRIIDLSLRGFRARCPSGWRPDSGARLAVEWHLADIIKLDMQANVMRVKNGVIGCQWQPQDAESSAYLQRLIDISHLRKQARDRELENFKVEKTQAQK
jgi:PilZ domain